MELNDNQLMILILVIIGLIVIICIIVVIRQLEPYPFCHIKKDISGRQVPNQNSFIEECLCQKDVRDKIAQQVIIAQQWKTRMDQKHPTQKRKIEQIFNLNSQNDCIFLAYRNQTRYKQVNYQKHAYQVQNSLINVRVKHELINELIPKLAKYNFELTLEKANASDQRKLMSKELREQIKIRDNYTCQICGKQMFDEVGLHIDHIVPVKKRWEKCL